MRVGYRLRFTLLLRVRRFFKPLHRAKVVDVIILPENLTDRLWQLAATRPVRSLRSWVAGGIIACLSTTAGAQVQCDLGPSCDCEGCQTFLAECDSLPPVVPSYVMPPVQPAPSPGYPAPEGSIVPGAPGAEAMDPSSITAPAPPVDQFGSDVFQPPAAPPMNSLASSLGATSGAAGIPDMIGDFFGGGYNYGFVGADGATVATAGGDRRLKFAENNSPFPRNRVFFNFHHFHNAVQQVGGGERNLDRYTFGLERLILDGRASLEVRVPFSNTVSASPVANTSGQTDTEFGNVSLAIKRMLYQDQCSALSVGLGIVFPTGSDFVISGDVVDNSFANEVVHLQPFIGYYHAPTSRLFTQFFAQMDFATSGNDVTVDGISDELEDQTLLFLDLSIGYWLHRNQCAKYLRGIAPMVELHYSTSVEDQDYGAFQGVTQFRTAGGPTLFVEDARRDVLNLTGGLFFQIGPVSSLKVGAVAPLRDGTDKLFDSEIGVQFTRRY